jgi:drug/metabolite transporter (DMT)-like permease
METSARTACLYLAVGVLWGCTNPFLKRGQEEIAQHSGASKENAKQSVSKSVFISFLHSTLATFQSLLEPKLLFPFILNQLGGLFFYYLVAIEPMRRAAPLCNSLTFGFTAITAYIIGERSNDPILLGTGVLLVLIGVGLILSDEEEGLM